MPSGSRSIIVGAGIESAPPFTVGQITLVSGTTPDTISDSIMRQIAGPPVAIIIGATDPDPTDDAVLRMVGAVFPAGPVADSMLVGRNVSIAPGSAVQQIAIGTFLVSIDAAGNATNINNILIGMNLIADDGGLTGMTLNTVIGTNHTVSAQAHGNILIGNSIDVDTQDNNCVLIGNNATVQGVGSAGSAVAIGSSATVTVSRCIAIGQSAVATGNDSIAIGMESPQTTSAQGIGIGRAVRVRAQDGICIGAVANNANVGDTNSIALGRAASTFGANQIVIGGVGAIISTMVLGQGDQPNVSPTLANVLIRVTHVPAGAGNNIAGCNLNLQAGAGTGDAEGGFINFNVPEPGASGSAQQSLITFGRISAPIAATETSLWLWDLDTSTFQRVTVGADDSGGAGFKLLRIPN